MRQAAEEQKKRIEEITSPFTLPPAHIASPAHLSSLPARCRRRFGGLSKKAFRMPRVLLPANTQTTPNNIAPIPIMRAAMSVLLLTVLLALFPCPVSAALPPGYQDKLLCGAGQCRRPNKRVVASGMVGPQSMFVECLALTTGEVTAVKTWGSKTGVVLETLFAGGFHEAECGADRQQEDPVNQFDADPMGRHEL